MRELAGERVLVALNFWGKARRLGGRGLPTSGRLLLSTDPGRDCGESALQGLVLRPNEAAVVLLEGSSLDQ